MTMMCNMCDVMNITWCKIQKALKSDSERLGGGGGGRTEENQANSYFGQKTYFFKIKITFFILFYKINFSYFKVFLWVHDAVGQASTRLAYIHPFTDKCSPCTSKM